MKKIKYLIFPILLLISFSITYAIFSSSKSGSGNVSAANWLVKLETIDDEIDITGGRQNINFGSCEKFMPGNPCVLPLNIDATNTEVDTVVTLEIGEIVGATKEELDLAGVSFKISDGTLEGYSYNVGYRTKKNLNLVIDWELGNINDVEKTKADLNLSKIQNNITVPVSIIVRQALNTPRVVTFNTHVERISNPSSIEVIEGLTISNIPVIQDNEYEFDGWYTKEKGGVKLTNNTIITDDITYHAHYSNIRTITFNSYGGSNIDDIEVLSGNTISNLPIPTKLGYTFNGWYTNIVGGEQLTSSTEITTDRTYYAHWVTKYYTLTFNSDGSSVNPIQVQEGESLSSSNISMPSSEKQGYTLSGWFNNNNQLTTITQILSDLTYTASFNPNTYTVTFDYDGATGNNSTASKSVTYDSTYGSLPTPTKTGYTFLGWNGKNMFDEATVTKGNIWETSGEDNPSNSYWVKSDYIECKSNTDYIFSYDNTILYYQVTLTYYDSNMNFIIGSSIGGGSQNYITLLSPSNAKYIRISYAVKFSGGVLVEPYNMQLEEGNIVTSYEPYYVTSSTNVTQPKNHTLKAVWVTSLTNNKVDYAYIGDYQEFIAPETGNYKIELWGAQGGTTKTYVVDGGLGGYTSGVVQLEKNKKIYIYVGGAGSATSVAAREYIQGGYNGGGATGGQACCSRSYGSGGGATDIRLVNGSWDNFDSLKSRIMVAGAGGGAFTSDAAITTNVGGAAGGINGSSGFATYDSGGYCKGNGASQNIGGYIDSNCTYASSNEGGTISGGFGYGGGRDSFSTGGGSGYYGGARSGHVASAGGGSSFISGYSGCDAIAESSTSDNIIHTGQPNHYSGKVFTNGVMIDGNGCNWSTGVATNCGANQIQPDGTMAVGHSGNGYARITLVSTN